MRQLFRIYCIICVLVLVPYCAFAFEYKKFEVADYGSDVSAFRRLAADVNANGGGCIVFPENATFEVTIEDDYNGGHKLIPVDEAIVFGFKGCEQVDIDLNGSTFILGTNHSTKYAIFYFYNCPSFSIRQGTLVGDAKTHDYSPVTYKGKQEKSSHEWGHGVMVVGSKGTISNLCISNMVGDGIYVASRKRKQGNLPARVQIDSCDISLCRRNGISCASNEGFVLTDSFIHQIGTFGGFKGTDPQAGIDFEYEDGVGAVGDIIISGTRIVDCTKNSITAANTFPPNPRNFVVSYCEFNNGTFQIANLKAEDKKSVRNCTFTKAPIHCGDAVLENCTFTWTSRLSYVHGTTFRNCSFEGSVDSPKSPYGCCLASYSYEPACFENCTFRNIRGMNSTKVPAYPGISAYVFPMVASFKSCTFSNCSFGKGAPSIKSELTFADCSFTDGCSFYNLGGPAIEFYDCKLDNVGSYMDQKGNFQFDSCIIVQDDASVSFPLLYYGDHTVKKSKIINKLTITPDMKRRGVDKAKIKIER